MIDSPIQRSRVRPWLVCESGTRWLASLHRFCDELMPPPLVASITPVAPAETARPLAGRERLIVLWEATDDNFIQTCDWLIAISQYQPAALKWIAAGELSDRELVVLSELGAAAVIRQPEHLPRLKVMVKAYFASSTHHLD